MAKRNAKRNLVNYISNGNESMKHWILKAMIFKILRERRRTVGVEYQLNGGIVDVLDMDYSIAYEIESKIDRNKVKQRLRKLSQLHDVFFIDADKIPDDLQRAEELLRKIIV